MRLPIRTPFVSPPEDIAHLYSLLYPPPHLPLPQADALRSRGVALVQSVYLARGGCPIAIECTAALVSAVLLDHHLSSLILAGNSSSSSSSSRQQWLPPPELALSLRQTLCLSLIRLVNSFSDSYQTGSHARSLVSIAEELALPRWFVEVRHRATHEELPSLEIAREAVRRGLQWLEERSWWGMMAPAVSSDRALPDGDVEDMPTVRPRGKRDLTDAFQTPEDSMQRFGQAGPSARPEDKQAKSSATTQREHLAALPPLLKAYKRLAKMIVRDESLRGRTKVEMDRALKQIDAWIKEGSALYRQALNPGQVPLSRRGRKRRRREDGEEGPPLPVEEEEEDAYTSATDLEGSDEDRALHQCLASLVEGLLQPGGLVPLSKAKRATKPARSSQPQVALPDVGQETVSSWADLLRHLLQKYDDFAGLLLNGLVAVFDDSQTATLDAVSSTIYGQTSGLPSSSSVTTLYSLQDTDASYRLTIYSWFRFIIDSLPLSLGVQAAAQGLDESLPLQELIATRMLSDVEDAMYSQRDDEDYSSSPGQTVAARTVILNILGKLLGLCAPSSIEQKTTTGLATSTSRRTTRHLLPLLRYSARTLDLMARAPGKSMSSAVSDLIDVLEAEARREGLDEEANGEATAGDGVLLDGFDGMTNSIAGQKTGVSTLEEQMALMEQRWKEVVASASIDGAADTDVAEEEQDTIDDALPDEEEDFAVQQPSKQRQQEISRESLSALIYDRASLEPEAVDLPQAEPALPEGWSYPQAQWRAIPIGCTLEGAAPVGLVR